MLLTKEQIQSIVDKAGQPATSVLLKSFFNSYRKYLCSRDVRELYDAEYLNMIQSTPAQVMVDRKYKIHIYNRYSYEYICSKPRGSTILDIGCGTGDFLLALAYNGFRCTGLDFSEPFIMRAKERATADGLSAEFICSDVAEMVDSNKFDIIVMNDVTEHLSDGELEKMFGKVSGLLTPEGEIVIHTPNGCSLSNETVKSLLLSMYKYYLRISAGFRGFERTVSQLYYEQMHINIKSYRQLKEMLSGHGFATRVAYDDYPRSRLRAVLSSNMLVVAKASKS